MDEIFFSNLCIFKRYIKRKFVKKALYIFLGYLNDINLLLGPLVSRFNLNYQ